MATEGACDAAEAQRRELAAKLGCITEQQLQTLAGVKDTTTEAWRKRNTGPRHVRIGNVILYPVSLLSEFLQAQAKERIGTSAREVL